MHLSNVNIIIGLLITVLCLIVVNLIIIDHCNHLPWLFFPSVVLMLAAAGTFLRQSHHDQMKSEVEAGAEAKERGKPRYIISSCLCSAVDTELYCSSNFRYLLLLLLLLHHLPAKQCLLLLETILLLWECFTNIVSLTVDQHITFSLLSGCLKLDFQLKDIIWDCPPLYSLSESAGFL